MRVEDARTFGDAASRWRVLQRRDGEAARIIALVSAEADIPPHMLLHPSRCTAPVARARQIAMYLLHTLCSRSQAAVATAFGRDRTTVRHACALVEDAREAPDFEREMTRLEDRLSRDEALAEGRRHAG